MRNIFSLFFNLFTVIWLGLTGSVLAQSGPTVVELYTSQGCSRCPPADEFLGRLAKRDDVIALSLHVDYWDYIGWKDSFGGEQFTKRQHAYAYAANKSMVYTPQMVISGRHLLVGTKFSKVESVINLRNKKATPVHLQIEKQDGKLLIHARSDQVIENMAVQLVQFSEGETVRVKRGENAGKELRYYNVVTQWTHLQDWDGAKPLSLSTKISGVQGVVVIIQEANYGAVLAAARLR